MNTIKVAIGIIFQGDKVLLSSRPSGKFMQDFWEFAGGKIEKGESALECLKREFLEELGINVIEAKFLRKITQKYNTKTIDLEVFIIKKYQGKITPQEGQKAEWVKFKDVDNYNLLPTVNPLLNFATLPPKYWITPNIDDGFFNLLLEKINNNISLIQLRSKENLTLDFVKKVYQICQKYSVKLLLNIPNKDSNFDDFCDGYHLTSKELNNLEQKTHCIMSASTHNLAEVQKAQDLGLDFVVLSPIKNTKSHPEQKAKGFDFAKNISTQTQIPIYFLGGMQESDLAQVLGCSGVGIAGISNI